MIQYAINHFVTTDDGTDSIDNSTVHGDDSLHVWVDSDPTTDPADEVHEMPSDGWTWKSDKSGFRKHPTVLEQHGGDIERLDPWDTTLTDGYTQE
jgi:hypothetical protein